MIKLIRAIRENYFDNTIDLSKLSKTFLLWGAGLVLVYLANIFLIRLIGLPKYGQYTVFMNWVALMSTLVVFGWDGYLVQKIPVLPQNTEGKTVAGTLLKRAMLTFCALFIFGVLLLFTIVYIFNQPLIFAGKHSLLYFFSLVFFFTCISYFKALLKIFHIVRPVQWIEEFSKPLVLLFILGGYYFFHKPLSLSAVYFLNSILFFMVTLLLYFFVQKAAGKKLVLRERDEDREQWVRKCFNFMCIMLGYSFFSKMELLFLGYYAKNEDAAKYQLLLRIADLVLIPDFLFNYYMPQKFSQYFADKDHHAARALYRNAARTIFFLQVICLAGVAGIGYFYLQSFKIAGMQMYILMMVLCSAQLCYSLFGSTNLVLMTSGNEKYSFRALALVLIVEAIANKMFISSYGLIAAVYISWLSVLMYTLILYYYVQKKLKFRSPLTGF